jgi:hypothetical protein
VRIGGLRVARYNRGRAGIAQLVEQRFCKPLVVGSIPTAGIPTGHGARRRTVTALRAAT